MEKWRDVQGYEGLYQVSNLGRVKSLKRTVAQGRYGNKRIIAEVVLRPNDNGNGYLQVGLRKDNRRKQVYVHRLVAQHFLEQNYPPINVVNHKDHNTKNNRADNLEWVTQKENVLYSVERMKKPKSVSYSNTGHKYIYERNGKYRVCVPREKEKTFNSLLEALVYRAVILCER